MAMLNYQRVHQKSSHHHTEIRSSICDHGHLEPGNGPVSAARNGFCLGPPGLVFPKAWARWHNELRGKPGDQKGPREAQDGISMV